MIGLLAPPWIPVPPPGYGGIEAVVSQICDGLVERGHEVVLFAAPGSQSAARVEELLAFSHGGEVGAAQHEADHVARAFEHIEAADVPFDVLHDHCGFTALAMADRIDVPIVHTVHGPLTRENVDFYRHHWSKAYTVALSPSQGASLPRGLEFDAVIPNPIDVREWPFEPHKDDYLLWLGRMDESKGPHRAIAAARLADVPLVLAGPVQPGQEDYFDEHVAPHIDDDRVRYAGEVGGVRKQRLFGRARGFLLPIRWPEPFGMVMIEAMACGTPVIAFREGAAVDIVDDGRTGFIVDDIAAMADRISALDAIDPAECRRQVAERYDVGKVVAAYERAYELAAAHRIRPRIRGSALETRGLGERLASRAP